MPGLAFWIAVAVLVGAAGKFLDDFHVTDRRKSAIRDWLVRAFVWLDEHPVPNLLKWLGGPDEVPRTLKILFLNGFIFATLLYATVVGLYARHNPNVSVFQYAFRVATALPSEMVRYNIMDFWWTKVVFIGFCMIIIYGILDRVYTATSEWVRSGLLIALAWISWIATTYILVFWPTAFEYTLRAPPGVGFDGAFSMIFSLCCISVAVLVGVVTLLVGILIQLTMMLRAIAANVLSVASSPKTAPFTYAGALIGILVLCAQVVKTWLTL